MAIRGVDDLVVYRLAREFKLATYELVRTSASAQQDFNYRAQLQDAASSVESNIAEGYHRGSAAEAVLFLRYALGSLAEARTRLIDGADCGHWPLAACSRALDWADRCRRATEAYRRTQARFARERGAKAGRPPPGKERRG